MMREKNSWLDRRWKYEEAEPVLAGNADLPDLSAVGGVASRYEAKESTKERMRSEGEYDEGN